jgi:hypothetical protein
MPISDFRLNLAPGPDISPDGVVTIARRPSGRRALGYPRLKRGHSHWLSLGKARYVSRRWRRCCPVAARGPARSALPPARPGSGCQRDSPAIFPAPALSMTACLVFPGPALSMTACLAGTGRRPKRCRQCSAGTHQIFRLSTVIPKRTIRLTGDSDGGSFRRRYTSAEPEVPQARPVGQRHSLAGGALPSAGRH